MSILELKIHILVMCNKFFRALFLLCKMHPNQVAHMWASNFPSRTYFKVFFFLWGEGGWFLLLATYATTQLWQLSYVNFKRSYLTRFKIKLDQICDNFKVIDVYFQMEQISLKVFLLLKRYWNNSEQDSTPSNGFRMVFKQFCHSLASCLTRVLWELRHWVSILETMS